MENGKCIWLLVLEWWLWFFSLASFSLIRSVLWIYFASFVEALKRVRHPIVFVFVRIVRIWLCLTLQPNIPRNSHKKCAHFSCAIWVNASIFAYVFEFLISNLCCVHSETRLTYGIISLLAQAFYWVSSAFSLRWQNFGFFVFFFILKRSDIMKMKAKTTKK